MAEFEKLDEKYIQRKELVTSSERRLEESRIGYEKGCEERDWLCATNADLAYERDNAHREALNLHARVIELESMATGLTIPPTELAEAVRECDW